MQQSALCECGQLAGGLCVGCGTPVCVRHVATLRPPAGGRPSRLGRPPLPPGPLQAAIVEGVEQALNDRWLCARCLMSAIDAALATLGQPDGSKTDPLAHLRELVMSKAVALRYSREERDRLIDRALVDAGGPERLMQEAARHAWATRKPWTFQGPKAVFRRPSYTMVVVGTREFFSPGNTSGRGLTGHQDDSRADPIVVDRDGVWYFVHPEFPRRPNTGKPFALPNGEVTARDLAVGFAVPVLHGLQGRFPLRDPGAMPRVDAAPELRRAIDAGVSTIAAV